MDFDHSVEIELKFKLSSKEIESLVSSSFFQERFAFSFKKTNITTYYDTSSFDLRKNKIAIRIRESEGYKEQTIKIPIGEINTIQKCHEISSPIESSEPDLSTIKKETVPVEIDLNQYHGSLKPIFITSIERTQWVYSEKGQTLLLCIDKGKISTTGYADLSIDVSELEIELASGEESFLISFSKDFVLNYGLTSFNKTKADRGYSLIGVV